MKQKITYLDANEVAELLNITVNNVRALTHRGRLHVIYLGGNRVFYDEKLVQDYALTRRRRGIQRGSLSQINRIRAERKTTRVM